MSRFGHQVVDWIMGRDTASMSPGIRGHCIGASYAYVLETDFARPWQLICVLILVTAMFVLLFSFTALVLQCVWSPSVTLAL